MTSNGRLTEVPTPPAAPKPEQRARLSGVVLLLTGGLIVAAAVLILQLFPILYGVLFPPSPPLPAGSGLMEHRQIAYGVDEWRYRVDTRACEVVAYFQSAGGLCPQPYHCLGLPDNAPLPVSQHMAQCEGRIDFAIFTMRWTAVVASDSDSGFKTIFLVSREVFWGGQIPPKMEDILNQMDEQQETGNTGE